MPLDVSLALLHLLLALFSASDNFCKEITTDLSETYIDFLRVFRHDELPEPEHIIPGSGNPHTTDVQPCGADVSAAIDTHTAHAVRDL